MPWAVLFLLTVYLTYSSAQFTVIQDGPISVSPGGSVRLTCSLSTGNVGGGNYPNWIYQILGSVPKLVIGSSSTSNQNYRPSWTSDRFTGSITGGSAVLSISKVEIGDTGDYYCVVWSGTQWIFGEGSQLIVLSGEVKTPSVFIYGPSEEELKNDKATMVCAIRAYTPRTLSVEWTVDGTKWTSGVQTSTESKQADNLYMKSSLFSLSTSEYNKHEEYGCKVIHQNKEIIQTFKRSECH
ncbi:immunoglobulin lambda-1 light chain-like isoform X5 [Dendrobates tinctorius]|uniref:immunoglobulin lambda-1 light chain-like isoform X5 n=1 Tax=Dendrobates tinctorius TaxID=92724 RepID=UPI003CCA690C